MAASAALFVYLSSLCQRAAEDVLRQMTGPSLETGTVFDALLSVNYCAILIGVSVIAVREKCEEKGLRTDQGHRSVRCRQLGKGLPSAIPLGFARGFGKTGQAFSKSARRGAPQLVSPNNQKATRVRLSTLM